MDRQASNKDILFTPSKSEDPSKRWVVALKRFYDKHEFKLMSHDLRTSCATNMYNGS